MDPHRNRDGEQGHFPFRSERLCQENGRWYFNTREGSLEGPFRTQAEARRALAVFVAAKMHASLNQQTESSDHTVDTGDDFQHMVEELLGFLRLRSESGVAASLAWAHTRIAELKADREGTSCQRERIDILMYVMDHDQHFAHR